MEATKKPSKVKKLWKTIRITSFIVSVLTQLYYIFQLLYTIIQGTGDTILGIDIAMLAVSSIYLIFFFYATVKGEKKLKKNVAVAFKWSKRLIKIVNLGIMLYLVLSSPMLGSWDSIWDTLVILFSIFMWCLDIFMAIVSMIVKRAFRAIIDKMDINFDGIKKSTGKFFKKFTKKGRAELAAAKEAAALAEGEEAPAEEENGEAQPAEQPAEEVAATQDTEATEATEAPAEA